MDILSSDLDRCPSCCPPIPQTSGTSQTLAEGCENLRQWKLLSFSSSAGMQTATRLCMRSSGVEHRVKAPLSPSSILSALLDALLLTPWFLFECQLLHSAFNKPSSCKEQLSEDRNLTCMTYHLLALWPGVNHPLFLSISFIFGISPLAQIFCEFKHHSIWYMDDCSNYLWTSLSLTSTVHKLKVLDQTGLMFSRTKGV